MRGLLCVPFLLMSLPAMAGEVPGGTEEPVLVYERAMDYLLGRNGRPKDPARAAACFERLARAGWAVAQNRLGELYEQGLGVPRDLDQARVWFRRAAAQGHPLARAHLSRLGDRIALLKD